ncbi:MAG: type II toxin-antitoxin system PemK/MazF family toxin [Acidobacteria bacterium]|nr:type II toxin-antitoxin system PemK/MazF family toxin [Acidobacteriota bacterium]
MKRGDVWTASGGPDYAGKPRPVVVLQDDRFTSTASITICPLTTNPADAPLLRPSVRPTDRNGLKSPCRVMVDKITTVPRARLGVCIGRLDDPEISRLDRAVLVFLGLAG